MARRKNSTRWLGKGRGVEGVNAETEEEKLARQVAAGEVQIGPRAARRIAKRIEEEGGFWGPRKERKP